MTPCRAGLSHRCLPGHRLALALLGAALLLGPLAASAEPAPAEIDDHPLATSTKVARTPKDFVGWSYDAKVAHARSAIATALPTVDLADFPQVAVERYKSEFRVRFEARLRTLHESEELPRRSHAIQVELVPGEPVEVRPGDPSLLTSPPTLARELEPRFQGAEGIQVGERNGAIWVQVSYTGGAVEAFTYDPESRELKSQWHEHPAPPPPLPGSTHGETWVTVPRPAPPRPPPLPGPPHKENRE